MFLIFSRREKPSGTVSILNPPGTFELAVVGESHYQNVLAGICGEPTEDGYRVRTDADLVMEDENPYESIRDHMLF